MEYTEIVIAVLGFLGSALGAYSGFRLTAYRVGQLEKKVDKHNNFAARIPVVEEQIKVINHRIDDLEKMDRHFNEEAHR